MSAGWPRQFTARWKQLFIVLCSFFCTIYLQTHSFLHICKSFFDEIMHKLSDLYRIEQVSTRLKFLNKGAKEEVLKIKKLIESLDSSISKRMAKLQKSHIRSEPSQGQRFGQDGSDFIHERDDIIRQLEGLKKVQSDRCVITRR